MIKGAMVKGVLIDLDGTLLDTVPDLAAACNGMMSDLGLKAVSATQVSEYVGKGAEVLVHRCLTSTLDGRAEAGLFAKAMRAFGENYHRTNGLYAKVYDGVFDGLEAMRLQGLKLACVTNKPFEFAEPLLEATKLRHYFEFVQGGDTIAKKKPDPLPMLWAASRLGLPSAQCAAIGDSINDALAGRVAGMRVLMVPYGYNEGRAVMPADCHAIIPSLAAAMAHFD
jgi:phosphoglycolate phosphatase